MCLVMESCCRPRQTERLPPRTDSVYTSNRDRPLFDICWISAELLQLARTSVGDALIHCKPRSTDDQYNVFNPSKDTAAVSVWLLQRFACLNRRQGTVDELHFYMRERKIIFGGIS